MRLAKRATFVLMMLLWALGLYGQNKETLAVLPFIGGADNEGETIAELFSFNERLNDIFNIVPRTAISEVIRTEQRFQRNGITDPETAVSIANNFAAQYIVSGIITNLGQNNLLVISIIKIKDIQQIAGDIVTYNNIEEIPAKLPDMANNIIAAAQITTALLPKLAVPSVELDSGADKGDADVLAQILAIHLIRSGKYAVYPRTSSLEQLRREYDNQRVGFTADEQIVEVGKGVNPHLALSVIARKLGNLTMFNAAIQNLERGIQETGTFEEYRTLDDGIQVMEIIAKKLTGVAETEQMAQEAEALRLREQEAITAALAAAEAANEAKRAAEAVKAAKTLEGKEAAAKAAMTAAEKADSFSNKTAETAPYSEAAAAAKVSAEEAAAAAQTAKNEADAAHDKREVLRAFFSNNARLFSFGVSIASSLTAPWLIGTVQGTFTALKYTFFDIGCDFGFIHGYEGWESIAYHSFYPFAHFNVFVPFGRYGGWYTGLGGGYMMAYYSGSGDDNVFYIPALDAVTGLYLGKNHHYFTLGYAIRTKITFEFKTFNYKVGVGYSYRFR